MSATVDGELRSRVAAGAAWLDQHHPGWWRADRPVQGEGGPIDLDALDMARSCRCVLGQLVGDYYRAEISLDDAARFGFDADIAQPDGDGQGDWEAQLRTQFEQLAELWQDLIERRRGVRQ